MLEYKRKKFDVRQVGGAEIGAAVFEKIRSEDAFLLEGGRWAIVGWDPFLKVKGKNGKCFVTRDGGKELEFEGEPLDVLQEFLGEFRIDVESDLPFVGGAVGYLSYDYGAGLLGVEQQTMDEVGIWDLNFVFVDKCFVCDLDNGEVWGVVNGLNGAECEEKLLELAAVLESGVGDVGGGTNNEELEGEGICNGEVVVPESNLSKSEYLKKIDQVQDFLKKGESYEVNFAHRFKGKTDLEPWEIYKKMSQKNFSPFGFYFEGGDFQVISNSPERLVNCVDGVLSTRPIKGTMPRGKDETEDRENEEKLLASEKDAAELNMIVDLARNDLGRVAEGGSVKVVEHRVVEKYANVMHTVSEVRAKMKEGVKFADVVRSVFPGGSITGAPKKRTVEIIDELEDVRRGIYCGSAGYVSWNGDFDLNIMIRTMTYRDGEVFFHSGGGIVADSVGEEEWQETLDKAGVLKGVLEDV